MDLARLTDAVSDASSHTIVQTLRLRSQFIVIVEHHAALLVLTRVGSTDSTDTQGKGNPSGHVAYTPKIWSAAPGPTAGPKAAAGGGPPTHVGGIPVQQPKAGKKKQNKKDMQNLAFTKK